MRFLKIKSKKQKQKNGPMLTYKKGNLGPVFNFTAYIYIFFSFLFFILQREREVPVNNFEVAREGLKIFEDALGRFFGSLFGFFCAIFVLLN